MKLQVWDDEVVLRTFATLERQLNDVADIDAQRWVRLALRIEVDHLPIRHAGAQADLADKFLLYGWRSCVRRGADWSCHRRADEDGNCEWNGGKDSGKHLVHLSEGSRGEG